MSEIDDLIYDALDASQELAELLRLDDTTIEDALVWIDDTAAELGKIADGMKVLRDE